MDAEKRKVDEKEKSYGHLYPELLPLMRVHHDLMTKRTVSPHVLRNKLE